MSAYLSQHGGSVAVLVFIITFAMLNQTAVYGKSMPPLEQVSENRAERGKF